VCQGFIIISKSFSYKDSLFILTTKRKEDFIINSTFRSDFLLFLGLLNGDKSDSSIYIYIYIYISFCFCPKYISCIKKIKEKKKRTKKVVEEDIYWFLPYKTKQGKLDQINLELAQM
jgi:hypothetical protein